MEPTEPAAPDTTSVSPAFGLPISINPCQAVSPGSDSTQSTASAEIPGGSLFSPWPSLTAYSVQPIMPTTRSPTAKPSCLDSTTSATPLERITSPSSTGGM